MNPLTADQAIPASGRNRKPFVHRADHGLVRDGADSEYGDQSRDVGELSATADETAASEGFRTVAFDQDNLGVDQQWNGLSDLQQIHQSRRIRHDRLVGVAEATIENLQDFGACGATKPKTRFILKPGILGMDGGPSEGGLTSRSLVLEMIKHGQSYIIV